MNSLLRYQERLKTTRGFVNHSQEKMIRTMVNRLAVSKHKLDNLHAQLEALGPYNVLSRGFSILQDKDGRVIRNAIEVAPGDFVEAHLFRGKLRLRVEGCEPAMDPEVTGVIESIDLEQMPHKLGATRDLDLTNGASEPLPDRVNLDLTVGADQETIAEAAGIDDVKYDQAIREFFHSDPAADVEEIVGKVAEATVRMAADSESSASNKRSIAKSKAQPTKGSSDADPDNKQLRLTL
jgi:hypothetical protein